MASCAGDTFLKVSPFGKVLSHKNLGRRGWCSKIVRDGHEVCMEGY